MTRRQRTTAALFLAPAVVLVAVLLVYPIGYTVWLSLHDTRQGTFVGLGNYVEMATSPQIRRAVANTAVWVVVAPTVVTVVGLLLALLAQRVRMATAFRLVLFMPMAISFLAAGATFRLVYDADPDRGLLNAALVTVHDAVADSSPYPGATVREDAPLVTVDREVRTAEPVTPGEPVLLPLVGIPADEVPARAAQATAAPSGEAGVHGLVWRDFLPGGAGVAGQPDQGENGLPGVSVQLREADGGDVVGETVTDEAGRFALPAATGGPYEVRLAADNFAAPFRGLTWLGPSLVTPAVIGAYVWVWAGFAMVVISAGLAGVPRVAVESARVDGASDWQVLRYVTVPALRPVLAVVAIALMINVLKIFDLVLVLPPESAQPAASVLGLELYHESFTRLNAGLGSSMAVLLFALVLPGMVWQARRMKRQERREGRMP